MHLICFSATAGGQKHARNGNDIDGAAEQETEKAGFVLTGVLRKWVHSADTKFVAAGKWDQVQAARDVLSAVKDKYTPSSEGLLESAIDGVIFHVKPDIDYVDSSPDLGSISSDIQAQIIDAIQKHDDLKLTL